jgi:hypothetical protein
MICAASRVSLPRNISRLSGSCVGVTIPGSKLPKSCHFGSVLVIVHLLSSERACITPQNLPESLHVIDRRDVVHSNNRFRVDPVHAPELALSAHLGGDSRKEVGEQRFQIINDSIDRSLADLARRGRFAQLRAHEAAGNQTRDGHRRNAFA